MTDDAEDDVEAPAVANDRVLNINEAAISTVRAEVADAVNDIDRALLRLRQVLDERLPELRLPNGDNGEEVVP